MRHIGMRPLIALSVLLLLFSAVPANAQDREQDHEELRGLLRSLTEAVNSRGLDIARPLVHPHFTMITVDNRKFTSIDDFEAYWEGLFTGDNALLAKVDLRPEADELTDFLGDDIGIVHGTSNDTYVFTDGEERTMGSRWTAVVQKDEGIWKLSRIHFSANLLDNPILDAAKTFAYWTGGGGLALGLIIGGLLTGLLMRRRPA